MPSRRPSRTAGGFQRWLPHVSRPRHAAPLALACGGRHASSLGTTALQPSTALLAPSRRLEVLCSGLSGSVLAIVPVGSLRSPTAPLARPLPSPHVPRSRRPGSHSAPSWRGWPQPEAFDSPPAPSGGGLCLRQPIRPSLARASRRCASHSARMPAHSHSAALRAHAPAPVSVRRCATPRPPCAGPSAGLCRRHGQNSPSRRALFDPPLTPSGGTVAAVPVILRGPSRVRYALRLPVPARNILSPRLIVPSPASCLLRPPGLPARVCIPRRRPRLDHPSQVPPPLAPARLRGPSGTPDRFACPARRSSHLGQLSGSGVRSCPGPCIASARHGQRRRHGPPRQGQAKPSRPEDFDSPPYPPPGGLVRSPFFNPPSCPPRGLRLPRRPTLPFLVALLGVLAGLVHPLLFWCGGQGPVGVRVSRVVLRTADFQCWASGWAMECG